MGVTTYSNGWENTEEIETVRVYFIYSFYYHTNKVIIDYSEAYTIYIYIIHVRMTYYI